MRGPQQGEILDTGPEILVEIRDPKSQSLLHPDILVKLWKFPVISTFYFRKLRI